MINDMEQLQDEINGISADEVRDNTPIIGRVPMTGNRVMELDLLGFEFDPDDEIMYLNLGPRR